MENLTDRVEEDALAMMAEIDELGGAVACIESGWTQRRIADSAYRLQRRIESGERVVVGVNRFRTDGEERYQPLRVDPAIEQEQAERLARLRRSRDAAACEAFSKSYATFWKATSHLPAALVKIA